MERVAGERYEIVSVNYTVVSLDVRIRNRSEIPTQLISAIIQVRGKRIEVRLYHPRGAMPPIPPNKTGIFINKFPGEDFTGIEPKECKFIEIKEGDVV